MFIYGKKNNIIRKMYIVKINKYIFGNFEISLLVNGFVFRCNFEIFGKIIEEIWINVKCGFFILRYVRLII